MYSFIVSSIKNPNQPNIYIYMYIQINQIYTNIYIYNLFPLVHHTDFLITQTPPNPKPKTPPSLVSQKLVGLRFPQLHGTNM